MRLCRNGGSVLAAVALAACAARADLTPVSQDRTIRATVAGSYVDAQGTNLAPPADRSQAAGDLSPFNATVTNGFAVPAGTVGSDVSDASQNSQIGPTVITASADAAATDARFHSDTRPLQYSFTGTAGSTFSFVFRVSQPTPVSLTGMIHTDTTEASAENAIVNVSLNTSSGTALTYFASPSVGPGPVPSQYDAPIAFSGTLPPGEYSIFATASASPFFVPGIDSERHHASFQIKLEQVPEPAGLAGLAVIGAMMMRRRSTRGRGALEA